MHTVSNHNSEVENVDVGCNELRSEIKKLRERQTLVEGEMKSMELQVGWTEFHEIYFNWDPKTNPIPNSSNWDLKPHPNPKPKPR